MPNNPVTQPGQSAVARAVHRDERPQPCVLSIDDLRRLYALLAPKALEAVQRQLARTPVPQEWTAAQMGEQMARILGQSRLMMHVIGAHGEQVLIMSAEDVEPAVLPERINRVVLDSAAGYRFAMGNEPGDRFKLTFDFSETPGFNRYNPWSQPTPNESALTVSGDSDTWVAGVHETITSFLKGRGRTRWWLHTPFAFSTANWVVGIPVAFWTAYRVSELMGVTLAKLPDVLRAGALLYVFLVAAMLFRSGLRAVR